MKKFLSFLFVAASTVSVSAHAIGLESFYGRAVQRGHVLTCFYENTTGATQNMKYVVFNFEPISGDSASYDVQDRIDQTVGPGETLSARTDQPLGSIRVNYCKYLASR
ncbi:hypothetical protein SHI21_18115 [Bacteriovorax sp. PP10]|uniref:Uncharacterized protein n=1 Tax=Bacteriovorax antarcticus TaxID=3088717 RepID=A0ABU5W2W6_9BACT|nr:hypothetical protein [Bacteriovorax sp. PP10]MEA9358155.1 hypothetical protein [Bacteriovorax sp. PP10]